INSLGTQRPSDSYVQHGYAATDASLSSEVPSAVEYVYFLVGGVYFAYKTPNEKLKTVGEWLVNVFNPKDMDDNLNDGFRKRRIPASVQTVSYDLERRTTLAAAQSAKLSLIVRLQKAIAKTLEDEGFKQISDSAIRATTGKSREELVQDMANSLTYG